MKTIEQLKEYADKNRVSKPFLVALHNALQKGEQVTAFGDNPEYSTFVDVGNQAYRVVFTIEEQPIGWCNHISISLNKSFLPYETAVEEIIKKFGMKPLEESHFYIEEGEIPSINVISQI